MYKFTSSQPAQHSAGTAYLFNALQRHLSRTHEQSRIRWRTAQTGGELELTLTFPRQITPVKFNKVVHSIFNNCFSRQRTYSCTDHNLLFLLPTFLMFVSQFRSHPPVITFILSEKRSVVIGKYT